MVALVIDLIGVVGLSVSAAASPGNPVVTVQVEPGPYFVGQGVRIEVSAPSGELNAPTVVGGDLTPLKGGKPALAEFVLVPRRAGSLAIGSFQVRAGDRSVGSRPTKIEVAQIPASGRSATFRGGVGDFQVASTVEPTTIRVGQTVEYQITMTGPAAWGSVSQILLGGLPKELQIRRAFAELIPGPEPRRTSRYRLRAIGSGRLVLPPVVVAAFDPRSGRFLSRSTASQVVRVEAEPLFDLAKVDLGPIPTPLASLRRRWLGGILAGLGVLIGAGLGIKRRALRRWSQEWRRHRPVDWQREARLLARWASEWTHDPAAVAAGIVARLAHVIERSNGQRVAVLTPIDAEAAVASLTQDSQLAGRTRSLVARCDRFRFDANANATVGDLGEVVAEAVAILQALGRQTISARSRWRTSDRV